MKKYLIMTFVLFIGFISNVNAKEDVYFISSNGVEMTELQYNNIKTIHGEEFLNSMDLETFNKYYEFYSSRDLKIEKETNVNQILPFSNNISTEYKELLITKSSILGKNMITVHLKWKKPPKIRSYDVFGFRTNFSYANVTTKVNFYGAYTELTNNIKQKVNAYGISVKLPTDSDNISMQITFTTTSSGTIYASYQHAVKNISLNSSTNYVFSPNGLGNVFLFNDNSLFDKMQGVSINI